MDYIISFVLEAPKSAPKINEHLKLIVHGPGGSGKSVILRAVAHKLRQAGVGVVITAPTGVAAFNINGVTLHTALCLPVINNSYGKSTDIPPPRGIQLESMRTLWKHAKVLLLDEFGFVSDETLQRVDRHLRLATGNDTTPFGGIHLVMFGDLYQLPPPHGKPIFACERHWSQFRLLELQGNQRAAQDPEWAALLARLRVGHWTEQDVRILQSRVSRRRNGIQPARNAMHLHATREAVAVTNARIFQHHINEQHIPRYECPCIDTYAKTGEIADPSDSYIDPEDTGGLEALLTVAVGSRVMYKQNWDVRDGLVNGACGEVQSVELLDDQVTTIWVRFDKAGKRWCELHQTPAVAVERRSANYWGKNAQWIQRRQFPIVLAHASTIHKAQAVTLPEGIFADLGRSIKNPGQAYTALSRVAKMSLAALKKFNRSSLIYNKDAEWALTTLYYAQRKLPTHSNEGIEALWKTLTARHKNPVYYKNKLAKLQKPDILTADRLSHKKQAKQPQSTCKTYNASKQNYLSAQHRTGTELN